MREKGRLARFASYDVDPESAIGLGDDHPAAVDGRTLFPSTVVGTFESRRFLVSAENSGKIGKIIEKGPWAGFPVFTLTLEERATCPRSCHMWQGCFGNAMQWARRNDAYDPDFIPALKAEVITLVRETCAPHKNKPNFHPPKGIVVRLHVLGDFFSVKYVRAWASLMEALPELHVFGYSARAMYPADGDMSIASEIHDLNQRFPDRRVIRWSADVPGPGRAIVVDADPELPDVIVCPNETKASETCSTCALCWNPAAWGKTIAFLRHGMKGRGRVTEIQSPEGRIKRLYETFLAMADSRGFISASVAAICDEARISAASFRPLMLPLLERRLLQIARAGRARTAAVYRVFAEAPAEYPPLPPLPLPTRKARAFIAVTDGLPPKKDAKPVAPRASADAPLVQRGSRAVVTMRDPKTGRVKNPWAVGTADQFDIGTSEERIEALPETEKERIERLYGATFRPKEKP